jgi:large conductance mechanosensitive channel
MIREFKEFISKGNVIMLAVGFIMGVAFQSVVTSLVEDVIMPVAAIPFGEPNFDELTVTVNGSVIAWGAFVTAVIGFSLTALAVFLFVVRPYNIFADRISNEEEEDEAAKTGTSEIDLLTEIRDELRSRPN